MSKTIRPDNQSNEKDNNGATVRPSSSGGNNGATVRPSTGGGNDGATVRPSTGGGNDGATVRPSTDGGNDGATVRPSTGGSNNGATVRPSTGGGNDGATVRPSSAGQQANSGAKTVRQENGDFKGFDKSAVVGMAGGTSVGKADQKAVANAMRTHEPFYKLNGITYKVKSVISASTGEAMVLLVENGGNNYVLKLYYQSIHPNHDILGKVESVRRMGLLVEIVAHGVWSPADNLQKPTDADRAVRRDYELMLYYPNGTLDQLNLHGNEKLLSEYFVQMAASINLCHVKGFLHRDIKPANFLFSDKSKKHILLGDFGIAVPLDNNGETTTNQARTKVYAAPESYISTEGMVDLTPKSDYYSLGMTLICLWMGEQQFSEQVSQNERKLARMKTRGELPYPKDMSDHLLSLVMALTAPDAQDRPDFAQIQEWAKGGDPFRSFLGKQDDPHQHKFNVLFSGAQNLVAHSPEELAQLMLNYPDLGIRYLYYGHVINWLNEGGRPELALDMERVVKVEYPKDEHAGLYAACLYLDSDLPYVDVNGTKCTSAKEIASSLLHNFDKYKKLLKNPNDNLFIYLKAFDQKDLVNQSVSEFANSKISDEEALRRLIYRLDPLLPYILISMDGRPILCSKPEDLLRDTDITDESMDSTYSDSFFIWLSKRDMDALSRIRRRLSELPADSQIQYPTVLYNLSPKVSYDFCLDESEGSYIFTHLQIAEFINNAMDDYVHQPKDSSKWEWADDILTDVNNIDGTILYAYLKSKDGLYDQWIKWLRDCCNVKSKENQKKAAPFNWRIATYKAIKGMGFAPYYRFPKSNITVTHPDELNKVPKDEILTEMESGMLKDWLAIFYQEDPGKKFQVKYSFEQEAANYTEMVGSLNPNDNDYLNFHNAQNQVLNTAKKLKSTRAQVFALRIIVALFCFIPIIGIIIMLLINGLPWSESPMPNWNTNAISVMTLIFGVLVFFFGDGLDEGCIGGLVSAGIAGFVISLVIYYILYFVLWLLMPVAPYIIIALLLLLAFFIYKSCYRTPSLKIGQHAHLFQPDQEHTILEPLDFAYLSTDSSFDSSIHDESMDYLDILKDGRKKLFVRAIPISIATVVLLFLLINYTYGSWSSSSTSQDTEEYEQLVGEWKGTFDNRNATITIYEIGENGNLTGNISVRYKNQLNEKFNGTVNLETGDVIFDDMVQNGNLDGIYRGELKKNYENMFIDGTYTNKKTGKSVKYTFSKPIQQ